ncbi:MAG: hypothetical protein V4474_04040 [Patescibacteria group bacterium]
MAQKRITKDLIILGLSILFALVLMQSGVVEAMVAAGGNIYITSFVAGIFFTSVITTAPAIAVFGGLQEGGNILLISLVGGAGAVVGDYLLFAFMRNRMDKDVEHLISKKRSRRLRALFSRPTFKWFTPFIAGVLIAIPLPTDELAMTLLSIAKLPNRLFIPLAFAFNTIGIYCICVVGHAFF